MQENVGLITCLVKNVAKKADRWDWHIECDKYWPSEQGEQLAFDDLKVTCNRIIRSEDNLNIVSLTINHEKTSHDLVHVHFKGFPDLGVPRFDQLRAFNLMIEACLETIQSSDKKVLLHCRQGYGRSGTTSLTLSLLL